MDIASLLGFFIVLQAAMPSAVSLPIVANLRKADSEFISQAVLFTHIFSIATVPVWLGLYMRLSAFSF
jgi:predicted permease